MCGFDGGAVGVDVGLMVVLPAWVWLGLYFGGFCGVGVGVSVIVGKKRKKNNYYSYNISIKSIVT